MTAMSHDTVTLDTVYPEECSRRSRSSRHCSQG